MKLHIVNTRQVRCSFLKVKINYYSHSFNNRFTHTQYFFLVSIDVVSKESSLSADISIFQDKLIGSHYDKLITRNFRAVHIFAHFAQGRRCVKI